MYIILELHGGAEYAMVCTNEQGENEVFDSHEEAEEYALDVQEPLIIEV